MGYATATDLSGRLTASVFAELYADAASAESDLAEASAEIDGNLGMRYAVPIAEPAALPLLKGWTLSLAAERGYLRAAGDSVPDKIKADAALVRKYLDEVRAGTFLVAGAPERTGGIFTLYHADEPAFGRDKMQGF